ncbi:MAG: winged helix-turn-helix domain-containing protein [Candidatus Altiarchaeota archaeon]
MEEKVQSLGGSGFMRVLQKHAASKGKRVEEIDIKNEIGLTAGEIYKLLDGKGDVPLRDVRMSVEMRGPLFAAALGWLMREDKIALRITKDGVRIKLK